MLKSLATLSLIATLAAPAAAENFFVAADAYAPGSVATNLKSVGDGSASQLIAAGSAASTKTTTDPGFGIRLGAFMSDTGPWDVGGSVGYIVGPKSVTTVTNSETNGANTTTGKTTITTETSFLRIMVEGGRRFPLPKNLQLRIGGAVGLSTGHFQQDQKREGTASGLVSDRAPIDSNPTGLTAEFSPSVLIPVAGQQLEVGVRAALIPLRVNDPQVKHFDWTTVGAFVAYRFGAVR